MMIVGIASFILVVMVAIRCVEDIKIMKKIDVY